MHKAGSRRRYRVRKLEKNLMGNPTTDLPPIRTIPHSIATTAAAVMKSGRGIADKRRFNMMDELPNSKLAGRTSVVTS